MRAEAHLNAVLLTALVRRVEERVRILSDFAVFWSLRATFSRALLGR